MKLLWRKEQQALTQDCWELSPVPLPNEQRECLRENQSVI